MPNLWQFLMPNLWGFLQRRRSGPDLHLHFVMYSRAGCHLCEEAWALLQTEQRRYRFGLERVDVDADPALAQRHGETVPVIMVNGKERFRGCVNPVLLRRFLEAESRGREA
jgi:glutaredoxin